MKKNVILKNLLLIILCLCFAFSLGCGGEENSTPPEKPEHYAIKVDGESAKQNIYNIDTNIRQEYLTSSELADIDDITGEYTGNAIGFFIDGAGYLSSGYRLKLQIDVNEYNQLKKENDYKFIYVWLCITYSGDEDVTLTNYHDQALNENIRKVYKTPQGDSYVQGKWFQMKFALNTTNKLKLFNDDGSAKEATLFRTDLTNIDRTTKLNIYVGDVGFIN